MTALAHTTAVQPTRDPIDAEAAFLRREGIDPATWTAFGCDRLPASTGSGILIPTRDPRTPEVIAGQVRIAAGQNKHRFITPPAGLAFADSFTAADRIVLTDHPLLAKRLYQMGVQGVALVEDPSVLPALLDALQGRSIIIASHRNDGLADLRAGLGLMGSEARSVLIPFEVARLGSAGRAVLGLPAVATVEPTARPPITPVLLARLAEYGGRHLDCAEGRDALRALGFDRADIRAAYHPGYLPRDITANLSDEDRAALAGIRLGNTIILPRYDEAGGIVDLVIIHLCDGGRIQRTLFDAPRGLVAPVVTTSAERIRVVDVPARIGRLWTTDLPVLYLSDAAEAQAMVPRIAAAGVRSVVITVRREVAAWASTFQAAGIATEVVTDEADRRPGRGGVVQMPAPTVTVEAPAEVSAAVPTPAPTISPPQDTPPLPAIALTRHDTATHKATFTAGPTTWSVDVPRGSGTVLDVEVRHNDRTSGDRFDLAVPAQRDRFATMANLATGLPAATIAATVAHLLAEVEALARPVEPTAPGKRVLPAAALDAARDLLRAPDLLARLANDLHLGIDPTSAALLVLAVVSARTSDPVWLNVTLAEPDAPNPVMPALAAIMEEDTCIHASRLHDGVLVGMPVDGLAHRSLLVDDAVSVSPGAATLLAVMRSTGSYTVTSSLPGSNGEMATTFRTVRGPVALITSGAAPAGLANHVVESPIDGPTAPWVGLTATERDRWHALHRLLRALPVRLPDDLEPPATIARHHRLRRAYRSVVTASAILHQQQRTQVEGSIIATIEDRAHAERVLMPLLAATDAAALGIGRTAHRMLVAMIATGEPSFTLADLGALLPGWCRWSLRHAVDGLVDAEFLTTTRSGRGGTKTYAITPGLPAELGGLHRTWRVEPATSSHGKETA